MASLCARETGGVLPVSALVWATVLAAADQPEVREAARTLSLGLADDVELVEGLAIWVPDDAARLASDFALAESTEVWVRELTVAQMAEAMEAGEVTSVELTSAYLARIEALDRHGPRLASMIAIAPDALDQAAICDRVRASSEVVGRLHGVPIVVKDNLTTSDGLAGASGSLALARWPHRADAPVVAALRRAGAVILGVTNLSAWSNFRSASSRSGWSARGGYTQPPFALGGDPCGSSSGSAVAVSANLAAASVGSETFGSLGCPAGVNGVVTIKPTLGLLSGDGVVPIALSFDTVGPMGRTVGDLVELLDALCGAPGAAARPDGYSPRPDLRAPVTARVGVEAGWALGPAVVERLAGTGVAVTAAQVPTASIEDIIGMLIAAARRDLPAHLAQRGAPSLEELVGEHLRSPIEAMYDDAYLAAIAQMPTAGVLAAEAGRRPATRAAAAPVASLADVLGDATGAATPPPGDPVRSVLDHPVPADGADAEVAQMRSVNLAALHGCLDADGLDVFVMADATALSAATGAPYAVVNLPDDDEGWTPVHVLGRPFAEAEVLAVAHLLESTAGARRVPDYRWA